MVYRIHRNTIAPIIALIRGKSLYHSKTLRAYKLISIRTTYTNHRKPTIGNMLYAQIHALNAYKIIQIISVPFFPSTVAMVGSHAFLSASISGTAE